MADEDTAGQPEDRAEEISQKIDFGDDFSLLVDATEEDLPAVHADGTKAAFKILTLDEGSTVNEARERFALPPIDGGDEVSAIVGLVNDRAVAYAKARAAELVTQLQESTRLMMRATIAQAIEEGWGAVELADHLKESPGFSEARAMTIARTEVIRANNQGNLDAYKGFRCRDRQDLVDGRR